MTLAPPVAETTVIEEGDLAEILAAVRAFVRQTVVPAEDQIESDDEVPTAIRAETKRMGLWGFALPQEHGGLGLTMEQESRLVIELGYTTPALRSMFGTNNGIAGHVLLEGGTEQQQAALLPRLASGELTASFALTEADAGSDPSTLTTTARRDGTDWVLDGAKRYITNAPVADVLFVFARTDPAAKPSRGISCFVVPAGTPGLSIGAKDAKMGQRGAWSADVHLDGVRVPADAVVGGEAGVDRGFAVAMRCLAHGRIHIAALCVGMAERLVDESLDYARERVQSGRRIGDFQLVQGLLADSVTDLLAGRALVLDAARRFDDRSDRRIGPSAAKYFCSEMVNRVADRAVQVHGGAGYMHGVPVERMYRDARLFTVYEGTSQIQQVVIAKAALSGGWQ